MRTVSTLLLAAFIAALVLIASPERIPNIVSPANRLLEKTGALYRFSTDPAAYDFYLGTALWATPAALCVLVWFSISISRGYKTERNDWSAKYRTLKFERDTLIDEAAAASSNANRAVAERNQFKSKVAELENTSLLNERLKQIEARLKERDDAIANAHKESDRLRGLVAEQRAEKDKLAIENARLAQALKHIPSEDDLKLRWVLQKELAEAKAKTAAAEAELAANDKLAIDHQEYESTLAERSKLAGINERLLQELDHAQSCRRKTDKLLAKLLDLVNSSNQRLKQVGKIRRDQDQTHAGISLLDEKIERIDSFVERVEKSLSDLNQQLYDLDILADQGRAEKDQPPDKQDHYCDGAKDARRVLS